MTATIEMLGNYDQLDVGCTASFKIAGVPHPLPFPLGDRYTINGTGIGTVSTDPFYFTYSSALPGTDVVIVNEAPPPGGSGGFLAGYTFDWVRGILCASTGPSAPVLTVTGQDHDAITIEWTPSTEFDPSWPTGVASYTLSRSRLPFSAAATNPAIDRTWTIDALDPLEVVDAANEANGPKLGIRYWYRVVATAVIGDSTRSNQDDGQLLEPVLGLDGLAYRVSGGEIATPGGPLGDLGDTAGSVTVGDGIDLSPIRYRLGSG